MPSPKWSEAKEAPIAAAIAAAVHQAWAGPAEGASARFITALRQMVGPKVMDRIEMTALRLFQAQPRPPEGFEMPPAWAWFQICPGCQSLRRTRFTAPQNGRVKLQVLRDPDWIAAQFEAGKSCEDIARRLGCSRELVAQWAHKHGIATPRAQRRDEIEATVRRMHLAGEGPGTIARALGGGMSADRVRQVLARLGLATLKHGQVYHDPEWWRVRLQDRGLTKRDCAREAGLKPHAATYWLKQFNLQHLVRNNRRRPRYPQLRDPVQLSALLERHGGSYESAAKELGCAPTLVSWYARRILGRPKKHDNVVPHGHKGWWVDRLEQGLTTWEMAEEAGITEKTARERLRVFGLLDWGYRNNYARERARRSA